MATEIKGKTYPKISRKLWWLLRDRLVKSIPSVVTPTLVTSLAQMAEGSARSNVIAPLRELGLLDADNKPTELAQRWRHDDEYKTVCHEIRENTYPQELVEAFHDAGPESKEAIKNWFMKKGQVGEVAAKMYADTYILLCQADLNGKTDSSLPSTKSTPRPSKITKREKTTSAASAAPTTTSQEPTTLPTLEHQGAHSSQRRLPAIHIDVQVHISPDTSSDQIDRIFESMAKHLGTYIK